MCCFVPLVAEVEGEGDSISALCTQITSAFSGPTEDPFSLVPMPKPASSPQSPAAQGQPHIYSYSLTIQQECSFNMSPLILFLLLIHFLFMGLIPMFAALVNGSAPAFLAPPVSAAAAAAVIPPTLPPPLPARDTNPWAKVPTAPPAPAHPGKCAQSLCSPSPK